MCGTLAVEIDGRRIDHELPGRQGRTVFAYLVVNRLRAIRRDELVDALWPRTPPAAADTALRALLSKLRRVLPDNMLDGRAALRLSLPRDAFVDLEDARAAIHRAESALALGNCHRAWGASLGPMFTARRGFLPDEDAGWVQDTRHELEALYCARSSATRRPAWASAAPSWPGAERAGHELTKLAPYRESGYRHLMRALAAAATPPRRCASTSSCARCCARSSGSRRARRRSSSTPSC